MTREEYIAGLRAMADWLDAHPGAPVSVNSPPEVLALPSGIDDDVTGIAWVRDVAAAIGASVMERDDSIEAQVEILPDVVYRASYVYRARMDAYEQHMASAPWMR